MPAIVAAELDQILPYLAPELRRIVGSLPERLAGGVEEIRLRRRFPLMVRSHQEQYFLDSKGQPVPEPESARLVGDQEMETTLQLICQGSVYAYEEEFRQGYLTLPGGHRVGLVGRVVLDGQGVKTLREISSLNFRIARAVPGAARKLVPYLIDFQRQRPYHTLLVSPPCAGKTTMLRDLVRILSTGLPELRLPGLTVGVADERGELAACYRGVPQHDLGPRVDVLDHCPKGIGMVMLLRSMSPQVVATDEIGRPEDVAALWEMVNTGTSVLATAHASCLEELERRPYLRELIRDGVFERYVFLSRSKGPGTIEEIRDGNRTLYSRQDRRVLAT